VDELTALIAEGRARLFEARAARARPATDDKVLAGWNGLAVSALAEAGRTFAEPGWVAMAAAAAEFVLGSMRAEGGRLHRAWRDGRLGAQPGYLDDQALVAEACLTLYETTFELRWLQAARALADELLALFADPDGGGFFQTGSDAERLVVRPRELFDNAVPAGNSVAAELLARLAHLAPGPGDEAAADGALALVAPAAERAPTAFGHALGAIDLRHGPVREIAVSGPPEDRATLDLVGRVWDRYLPNKVLAVAAPGDEAAQALVELLRERPQVGGRPTAFVCEHFACKLPVTDPDALAAQLDGVAG